MGWVHVASASGCMTCGAICSIETMTYTNAVQKPLMPKGVEHLCADTWPNILASVQKPLMPKGVEHFEVIRSL